MFSNGDWSAAFTQKHRECLGKLGLYEKQIYLLGLILDRFKFALRKRSSRTDMLDGLEKLTKAMEKIRKRMAPFLVEPAKTNLKDEMQFLIRVVDVSSLAIEGCSGVDVLQRADDEIRNALCVLNVAKSFLPNQVRHKRAKWLPIQAIDEVLREGFRLHHGLKSRGKKLPKYNVPVSRGGVFADVVRICREAVSTAGDVRESESKHNEFNPDRAIREYLKSEGSNGTARHKSGRKPSRKSKLPS